MDSLQKMSKKKIGQEGADICDGLTSSSEDDDNAIAEKQKKRQEKKFANVEKKAAAAVNDAKKKKNSEVVSIPSALVSIAKGRAKEIEDDVHGDEGEELAEDELTKEAFESVVNMASGGTGDDGITISAVAGRGRGGRGRGGRGRGREAGMSLNDKNMDFKVTMDKIQKRAKQELQSYVTSVCMRTGFA